MPKKKSKLMHYKIGEGNFVNLQSGESFERPQMHSTLMLRHDMELMPQAGDIEIMDANHAAVKLNWPQGRDGEFLYERYRALSSTTITASYYPVEYTADVLKKATKLIQNKPFLKNHINDIDHQIGSVIDSIWDDGTSEGTSNKPGINALVRVNLNAPAAANAIPLIEAGDARSVSVGIQFEWDRSHKDTLDADEFWWQIGEEVDGEMVRIVATKIVEIHELSLVWTGADPDAKKVEQAATHSAEPHLDGGLTPKTKTDPREDQMTLDQMIAALGKVYGVSAEEVTDEFVMDVINGVQTISEAEPVKALLAKQTERVEEYAKSIAEKDTKIIELDAKLADSAAMSELGAKYIEAQRDDTLRLFRIAKGEGNEALESLISAATLEQLQALSKEYAAEAEQAHPLTCDACGGSEVSRASSLKDENASNTDNSDAADTAVSSVPTITL